MGNQGSSDPAKTKVPTSNSQQSYVKSHMIIPWIRHTFRAAQLAVCS